jgi:hypothetical protein
MKDPMTPWIDLCLGAELLRVNVAQELDKGGWIRYRKAEVRALGHLSGFDTGSSPVTRLPSRGLSG